MRLRVGWLLLVVLLCLGAADVQERTVVAEFAGELTLTEIELPPIEISGSLLFDSGQLRLEFEQNFTEEAVILLVDFTAESICILYPDTLNGVTAELADLGFAEYLERLDDLLATPMGKAPPTWQIADQTEEVLDEVSYLKVVLSHPDGAEVEYLLDENQAPRRIAVTTANWCFSCNLTDIAFDQPLSQEAFSYDADEYAIKAWQPEDAEKLPPI